VHKCTKTLNFHTEKNNRQILLGKVSGSALSPDPFPDLSLVGRVHPSPSLTFHVPPLHPDFG